MQVFLCINQNHEKDEVVGMCLEQDCNERTWFCWRCALEKHYSHRQQCKSFPDVIQALEEMCKKEENEMNVEKLKMEEIIKQYQYLVKSKDVKITQYREWITLIQRQQYKDPKIDQLIATMKRTEYEKREIIKEIFNNKGNQQDEQINKLYHQAESLMINEKISESLDLYEKILQINPNHYNSLFGKGTCLYKTNKFSDALTYYDQVLLLYPEDVESLCGKGHCLKMLGYSFEGIAWFDKALKVDTKHIRSLVGKGECLRLQDQETDALILYDQVLKIDSKNEDSMWGKSTIIYELLVESLRLLGRLTEAKKSSEEALAIHPNNFDCTQSKSNKFVTISLHLINY